MHLKLRTVKWCAKKAHKNEQTSGPKSSTIVAGFPPAAIAPASAPLAAAPNVSRFWLSSATEKFRVSDNIRHHQKKNCIHYMQNKLAISRIN